MSYQGLPASSQCPPASNYRRESVDSSSCDYVIFSDGSGQDADSPLIAGWSAVVIKTGSPAEIDICMGMQTHTSTGMAELSGIISGLQAIMTSCGFYGKKPENCQALRKRVSVFIFSDREDVVKSIIGENRRSPAYADRWGAFAVLEKYFDIYAVHVHRNTIGMQTLADVHASTCRRSLLEHYYSQRNAGHAPANAGAPCSKPVE